MKIFLILIFLLSVVEAASAAPPRYRVTDLGALSGPKSEAIAINDQGEVVGNADTLVKDQWGRFVTHGFLWKNGRIQDLGTLGGKESNACGINNQSWVVGLSELKRQPRFHEEDTDAFLWRNGRKQDLGPATIIVLNNSGEMAMDGASSHLVIVKHGRRRSLKVPLPHQFQNVAYPPKTDLHYWDSSAPMDINDKGQIITHHHFSGDEGSALINANGKVIPLAEGQSNTAYGINNNGQVVGEINFKPFLWQHGNRLFLPSLRPQHNEAYAINDRGQVVGHDYDYGDNNQPDYIHEHALLWQKGKILDLTKCLLANSGWTLQAARGINNHGQIVGKGIHNGHTRAFLLTPIKQ